MSQEVIYPSPAHAPYQTMNTSPHTQGAAVVEHHSSDEEKHHGASASSSKGAGGKSRRELPAGAVATLKAWLLSPEHFTHPYPTPQDQIMLMHKTGIDKKQLKNWFTNARRRIWKPMLKKQLEAGKLAAAGGVVQQQNLVQGGGGGMAVAVPQGMGVPQPELSGSQPQQPPQQEMYQNYQQVQQGYQDPNQQYQQQQQYQDPNQQQYQQQQQQQPMYDQYGNQVYQDPNQQQQQYQDPNQQQQQPPPQGMTSNLSNNFSIGSLAPLNPMASTGSFGKMIKTDSHAVLMELFARDQDLVRQAAGKGGAQVQQAVGNQASAAAGGNLQSSGQSGNLRWAQGTAGPAASPGRGMGPKQHSVTFQEVPSLSSWPHFSSVSSLNNLGGAGMVKSITNLSAADLSSQGNLNKMGNLAQVKSIENMGRGDSFAFLEVFFDDKSGMANSTHSNGQRGVKRDREEDDGAIGLSLDGDDGPSPGQFNKQHSSDADQAPAPASGAPTPAPLPEDGKDSQEDANEDSGKLKRAYDDALAARGLIAVRRSCEKLTDLALPAKMQRTLSQEYIRQHNQGQPMGDFFSTNNSQYAPNSRNNLNNMVGGQQQYPTQQPVSDAGAPQQQQQQQVQVPSSTKCSLCSSVNVDTQLRPCGHMFHGRCLKGHFGGTMARPPQCPICHTSMQSAILAVPSATGADGPAGLQAQGGVGVTASEQ